MIGRIAVYGESWDLDTVPSESTANPLARWIIAKPAERSLYLPVARPSAVRSMGSPAPEIPQPLTAPELQPKAVLEETTPMK